MSAPAVEPIEIPKCPFCEIVAGRAPAEIFHEWDDALAIVPLNPVTEGHLLVIPKVHVADVGHDPDVSAATMQRAAQLAASQWCNVITSRGRVATQSVFHLHVHLVPRAEGDLVSAAVGPAQRGPGAPGRGAHRDSPRESKNAATRLRHLR
jgi:histidine triad (HIT) family protein